MRLVLAHLLALLAAPIGAAVGVLGLAKAAGRLTTCRDASSGSSWMYSMPMGGRIWQTISVLARALAAFGVSRIAFALLGVQPTAYFAGAVVLILLAWDVWRLRLLTRAPALSPPVERLTVERFKIGVGLLTSSLVAYLFVHT